MQDDHLTPSASDDLRPTETTWSREARTMLDAGAVIYGLAVSLPDDSDVRGDMLGAADMWLACARLRGMRSPIGADVARDLKAAQRLEAERVLAEESV